MLHLLMDNFEASWSGREARLTVAGVYPKFPQPALPLGLSGVTQCISKSAGLSLPAFDTHCPICSLPLAFGTRLDTDRRKNDG
jgi:hypothetical protein